MGPQPRRHTGPCPGCAALDVQASEDVRVARRGRVGREGIERYERALATLAADDREAVIARLELGYTYEEIAQMLQKPSPEAARKTIERAIVRLVQELTRGV